MQQYFRRSVSWCSLCSLTALSAQLDLGISMSANAEGHTGICNAVSVSAVVCRPAGKRKQAGWSSFRPESYKHARSLTCILRGALQHEEHERANARCLCCSTHTALAGSAFPLALSLLFVAFKSTQACGRPIVHAAFNPMHYDKCMVLWQ